MLNKNITLYSKTGRISVERIASIVNSHIIDKNVSAAKRTLSEYKHAVESIYSEQHKRIREFNKMIRQIENSENEIEQYKHNLINSILDDDIDTINKPKYRIIKKNRG